MKYINRILITITIILGLATLSYADFCFNIEFPGKATLDNTTTKGNLGDLKSSAAYYDTEGLSLVADKMIAPESLFKQRTNDEIAMSIVKSIANELKITDIKRAKIKNTYIALMAKGDVLCRMAIFIKPPNIILLLAVDFDRKHNKEVMAFFKSFKEIDCNSAPGTNIR